MNSLENINFNNTNEGNSDQQPKVLSYKLVILGDIAVGKSSIAQR